MGLLPLVDCREVPLQGAATVQTAVPLALWEAPMPMIFIPLRNVMVLPRRHTTKINGYGFSAGIDVAQIQIHAGDRA